MNGFLIALPSEDPRNLPSTATISVVGRSASEFPVEFNQESNPPGEFKVKNLPKGESLVFQVSANTLDSTLTFPITVSSEQVLNVLTLPSGTIQLLKTQVTQAGGVLASYQVDNTLGIVMGVLSPTRTGCIPMTGVDIVSQSNGNSILTQAQNGPFYFTSTGQIIAGQFSDPECSYIIFNVPAGNYRFVTKGSGVSQADIVIVPGGTVLGYGLPGQT
jgi:hypothetical protein